MSARSHIYKIVVRGLRHLLGICPSALIFSVALSASAGAQDVPFKIEAGGQAFEGIGKLAEGHFTGHGQLMGKSFEITGEIAGNEFTIQASGHLCVDGISKQLNVFGSGIGRPATGKLSIAFSVTCRLETSRIVAYFDLSAAGGAIANAAVTQPPGPVVTSVGPAVPAAVAPVSPATPPGPAIPPGLANLDFGRYQALVIGNDNYANGLPALKTAAGDAQAVAQMLQNAYGFRVTVLLNATRDQIIGALAKYRQTLTSDDNLLIYYAGHGSYDQATDQGYWLPVDATPDDPSHWVSNTDITNMLKAIQARHVMVVADSCYSGTLTRDANVAGPRTPTISSGLCRRRRVRS